MAQCKYCEAVANAIEKAVIDPGEFLWEYDEFEKNRYECATCQKFLWTLLRKWQRSSLRGLSGYLKAGDDYYMLGFRERDQRGPGLHRFFRGIQMVPSSAAQNEFGFSILRHRINIMGIKKWIDQCDQNHIGKCHTITESACKVPDATGLIFIDVEKLCLVQQSKDGGKYRYAALSYVWGKTIDPFQTTMSNFHSLTKPNAFKQPENVWRLPNTIKDSILLTRTLGVQYLWVDRFCIIQDDEVGKPDQLASMTSIYFNSYFTIAATEGEDSTYGISGIGKKRPRTPPFEFFDFTPGCRMFASFPRRANIRQVYHTRGWTLQEWALSRRMIVFHDQTVTWSCQRHRLLENMQRSEQLPSLHKMALWRGQADPSAYCSAVDAYSQRRLTNPSDVLTAFDAFITMQSRAMKSGILYGLPELFFNNMLCWHHDIDIPQRRRVDSQGKVLKQFPSWSWVGWDGPTDMLLPIESSTIRMTFAPGRLTYPCIIDFYKIPANSSSEKREMIKDLHYYEDRGVTTFVKDEDSEEERWEEYKLVPPGEGDTLHSSTNMLYSTVIEFRTRRLITTLAEYDFNGEERDLVSIRGSKGQMIGTLDFLLPFHPLDLPKHNVEFICISMSEPVCKSHAHTRTPGSQYLGGKGCCYDECYSKEDYHWGNIREPASDWEFRCYDVLWIEWDGDIAYRKAIGQVWKEDWDAEDTEEVDIRLG